MKIPEFPKKLNFSLQEGACNQRCPKCFVHGTNNLGQSKNVGSMPRDQIIRLLEEARHYSVFVSPSFFSEPMVAREFRFFIQEAKRNGLPVNICTNGLLLDEPMIEFLIKMGVELLSVSIDANSAEVFKQVRGVPKFDKVVENTLKLLELRGQGKYPRVTVSFGLEAANRHERDAFIDFWSTRADCVKIYGIYDFAKSLNDIDARGPRLPCREVFDQMNIYFDGTALVCCLDGFAQTNLGNVYEEGILKVWNSQRYRKVRQCHIDNDYSDLKYCRDCQLWANFDIVHEELKGDILIRRSQGIEYHNRLARLDDWDASLRRIEIADLEKA